MQAALGMLKLWCDGAIACGDDQEGEGMLLTIDGPAGVGKSSVASFLACELGLLLLKSGAFYRALSLGIACGYARRGQSLPDCLQVYRRGGEAWRELWQMAQGLHIVQRGEDILLFSALKKNGEKNGKQDGPACPNGTRGEEVTSQLQTPELDILAPQISSIPPLRRLINDLLRRQAVEAAQTMGGLVAEGRDMGTVVFPQAGYKFFLEASTQVRALRRWQQLGKGGKGSTTGGGIAELERQIAQRDAIDRSKPEGALRPAEDARIIDTGSLTFAVVCQIIMDSLPNS